MATTHYVCFLNSELGVEAISADLLKGKNEKEILEYLNKRDYVLFMNQQFFDMRVESDFILDIDESPVVVSGKPDKDEIPEYSLSIQPQERATQIALHIQPEIEELEDLTEFTVWLEYTQFLSIKAKYLAHKIIKMIGLGFDSATILADEEEIDPESSLLDLLDQAQISQITFKGVLDEPSRQLIQKRANLIQEFLDQEENFDNEIQKLFDTWKSEIETRQMLSKQDISTIFDPVEEILHASSDLYNRIFESGTSYSSKVLLPFRKFSSKFSNVVKYVEKYPQLLDLVCSFLSKPNVAYTLSKSEEINIVELLALPITHSQAYNKFLIDITPLTPRLHPDFRYLRPLRTEFGQMTAEIDSMIEKVANQSSLVKINTSIQNNFHFLQECRKFIHSAPVIISGDKSGPGPGSFIIFNDIIVLVKRLSKTSKVFYDSPVLEFVYKRNSAAQHSISISFPKKSYLMKKKGGYVFTVDFHSENEEKTWFSKLREVQISRSLQQKGITAKNMIWEPFVTNKNIPEMADNKAIVFGNSVYIFNGTETSSELITISLEDNKVSQTQMPIKKASFKAFCLSIIGDKIYGPCTRGIFQYQPTMNTYKVAVLKGKGFEPLKGQTSVSIKNDLFIFGGENEQGIPQNTFYRFNPVEKTVASITEHLPEPRTNHTAVEHGGHMYIFGGRTNKGVTNQLLMYSPRRNKWMNIDINGLIPRENHVSIVANDIMVIIGGSEKAQAQFVDLKKKCLISVNELGNVPEIISRFAAILANNDKIVCIGGESNGALTNMIYEIKLPFELSQEIVHKRYDSYNEISATKEIPKLEFTPKLKRSKSPVNHVTKRNKKTMEEVSPLFDNSDPFNKTEEFPSIQSQIPVSLFESYTLTLPEEADLDDEAAEIAAKEAEEKRRLEEEERLRKEEEERKRKEKEEKRRLKEEKRKRDEMTNELNERLNLDANKVHDNDKDDLADVAEKAFNDVIKSREIPQEENEIPKIAEKVYLEGLTNASEKEVSKPLRDSIVDLRIKEEKEKLKDIIDNSPVEESPDLLANLFEQFENERKPICQLAEVIVNRNIQEKMENSPEDDKQKVTDLISKVLTDISKDDNLKFKDLDESKLDDIISQQMEDVDIEENEDLFHDLAKEAVGDVLSAVQLKGLEPALNQFANNAIDDVLNDQAVLESENKENAVKESIINNDDVPEKLAFEILDMMIPDVTNHYNETLDALPTIAIGLVSNLALVEQPNSLEKSKIALEKARDLCLANSNENEKVLKLTDEALSKLQNPDDLSSQDLINDFIANLNKDAPTNVVASILNSAIDNCLSAVNSNKDKSVKSIVKDSISAVDNKELENVISDLKSQSSIPINAAAVASVSLVAKTSLQAVSQHPDDPKLVEQAKESIKAAADLALVVIADDDELSKDVILMTTKFADRALDEHRNVSSEDELKTKLKDVIANQLKSDLLEAEKDKANSKDLIDLLDIAAMAKIASENESDPENKKDLDNLLNKCREEAIAKLDEINHHQIPIEEIEKIVDAMLNEMASKLESNPDMRQSSINYINEQLQKAKEAYEESPKDQDRDQFIYDYIMDNKPSVDDEDYDVISRDIDFGEFGEEITDEQIKDKLGDKADGLSKDEAMKALEDQMIGDIGSKLAESLVDRLLNDYHENELISQMVREAINAMVKDILAKMKDEDAEKIIQQVSASAMAQLALKHNPINVEQEKYHPHINDVATTTALRAADTLASLQKLQLREDKPDKELNEDEVKQIEQSSKELVDNLVNKSVEELEKASTDKEEDPTKAAEAAHGILSRQIKNFLEQPKPSNPETESESTNVKQTPAETDHHYDQKHFDVEDLTDFVLSRSVDVSNEETPLSAEEAALAEKLALQKKMVIPDDVIDAVQELASQNLEQFIQQSETEKSIPDQEQQLSTDEKQESNDDKTLSKDEKVSQVVSDIANRIFNGLTAEMEAIQTHEMLSKIAKDAIDRIVKNILDNMKDEDAENIIQQVSASAMAQLALKHNPINVEQGKYHPHINDVATTTALRAADTLASLQKLQLKEDKPDKELNEDEIKQIDDSSKALVNNLVNKSVEELEKASTDKEEDPTKAAEAAHGILSRQIKNFLEQPKPSNPDNENESTTSENHSNVKPTADNDEQIKSDNIEKLIDFVLSKSVDVSDEETPLSAEEAALAEKLALQKKMVIPDDVIDAVQELASQNLEQFIQQSSPEEENKSVELVPNEFKEETKSDKTASQDEKVSQVASDIANRIFNGLTAEMEAIQTQELLSKIAKEALDKIIKNILANMKDEDAENIIQQVSASAIADLALKHNPVDSDEEEHHKHINDVADSSASRAASTLASLQKLQLQEDDPSRQLNESEEKQIEESSKALVNNLVSKSVEALEQASTDKDESPEKAAEAAHSLLSKQIKNFLEQEKPTPSSAKTTTQPSTESTQPEPAVNIEDFTDFVLSRSVDVSNEETPLSAEEAALAEKLALQKKMVIPDDVIDAVQELASQNLEQFIQQSQAKEEQSNQPSQIENEGSSSETSQPSAQQDEKVSQVASDIANRIFNGLTAEMEAIQTQELLSKIAKDTIDRIVKNILDEMKDEDAEKIIQQVSVSAMAQLALKHNPEDEDEIQHHPHINEVADSSASRAADTLASLQKLQLQEDNPNKELNSEEIKQIEESSKSLVDNLVQKSVEELEKASTDKDEDPSKASEAAHGLLSKQIKNFLESEKNKQPSTKPQANSDEALPIDIDELTDFVVSRSANIDSEETPLSSEEAALAEAIHKQQIQAIPDEVIDAIHELASENLEQFTSKESASKSPTNETPENNDQQDSIVSDQPESESKKTTEDKVSAVASDIANRIFNGLTTEMEAIQTHEMLSNIAKEALDKIIKNILDNMKDEDAENIIQQVSASAMAQLALKHNPINVEQGKYHPHINDVATTTALRAADTLASLQKLQLKEDKPDKELNEDEIKQIDDSSKALVNNLVNKSVEELEKASTDKEEDPTNAAEAAHGILSRQIKNFLEQPKPSLEEEQNESKPETSVDVEDFTDFVLSRSVDVSNEETPLSAEEAALAEKLALQKKMVIPDDVIDAVQELASQNLEQFIQQSETEEEKSSEEIQNESDQTITSDSTEKKASKDEKVSQVASDIANRIFNGLTAEMEAVQTQEMLSKIAKDAIDGMIKNIMNGFKDEDAENIIKEVSVSAMAHLALKHNPEDEDEIQHHPHINEVADSSASRAADTLASLQKLQLKEDNPNKELNSEEIKQIEESSKSLVDNLINKSVVQLEHASLEKSDDPSKASEAAHGLLSKQIKQFLEQEKITQPDTETKPNEEPSEPINIDDLTTFVVSQSSELKSSSLPMSQEEETLSNAIQQQQTQTVPREVVEAIQDLASYNLEQFYNNHKDDNNNKPDIEGEESKSAIDGEERNQPSETPIESEVVPDRVSSDEKKVEAVVNDIANRVLCGLFPEIEALKIQEALSNIAKEALDKIIKNILANMKDEDAENIIQQVSASAMAQLALKHNPEDEEQEKYHPHINDVADESASRAANTLASLQKLQLKENDPSKELNEDEEKQIEQSSKELVNNLVNKSVEELEKASTEKEESPEKAAEAARGLLSKQIKYFLQQENQIHSNAKPSSDNEEQIKSDNIEKLTDFVLSRSVDVSNEETPLSAEEAALAEKLALQKKMVIPDDVIDAVQELASQNLEQFTQNAVKQSEDQSASEVGEEKKSSQEVDEKVSQVASDIANRIFNGLTAEMEAIQTQELLSKIAKDTIDRIVKNILDEMKDEDAEKIIQQVSVSAMAQLALKHNPEDEDEIQHHPHINEVADSSASRAADTLASLQKLQLQEDNPNKELNSEEIKQIEESSKSLVDNLVQKSVEELEKASTDKDEDPSKASEAAHGLLSKQIKNFLESEKNKQPSTKPQANSDEALPIDIDELTDFVVSRSANIDSEETPLSSEEAALAEAIHKQQIQAIPDEVIDAIHELASENLEQFTSKDSAIRESTFETSENKDQQDAIPESAALPDQPESESKKTTEDKVSAVASDIANRLFNGLSPEIEALQIHEALSNVAKEALDKIIKNILDNMKDEDAENIIQQVSASAMAQLALKHNPVNVEQEKYQPHINDVATTTALRAADTLASLQKLQLKEDKPDKELNDDEVKQIEQSSKALVNNLVNKSVEELEKASTDKEEDPTKAAEAAHGILSRQIKNYLERPKPSNSNDENESTTIGQEKQSDDLTDFVLSRSVDVSNEETPLSAEEAALAEKLALQKKMVIPDDFIDAVQELASQNLEQFIQQSETEKEKSSDATSNEADKQTSTPQVDEKISQVASDIANRIFNGLTGEMEAIQTHEMLSKIAKDAIDRIVKNIIDNMKDEDAENIIQQVSASAMAQLALKHNPISVEQGKYQPHINDVATTTALRAADTLASLQKLQLKEDKPGKVLNEAEEKQIEQSSKELVNNLVNKSVEELEKASTDKEESPEKASEAAHGILSRQIKNFLNQPKSSDVNNENNDETGNHDNYDLKPIDVSDLTDFVLSRSVDVSNEETPLSAEEAALAEKLALQKKMVIPDDFIDAVQELASQNLEQFIHQSQAAEGSDSNEQASEITNELSSTEEQSTQPNVDEKVSQVASDIANRIFNGLTAEMEAIQTQEMLSKIAKDAIDGMIKNIMNGFKDDDAENIIKEVSVSAMAQLALKHNPEDEDEIQHHPHINEVADSSASRAADTLASLQKLQLKEDNPNKELNSEEIKQIEESSKSLVDNLINKSVVQLEHASLEKSDDPSKASEAAHGLLSKQIKQFLEQEKITQPDTETKQNEEPSEPINIDDLTTFVVSQSSELKSSSLPMSQEEETLSNAIQQQQTQTVPREVVDAIQDLASYNLEQFYNNHKDDNNNKPDIEGEESKSAIDGEERNQPSETPIESEVVPDRVSSDEKKVEAVVNDIANRVLCGLFPEIEALKIQEALSNIAKEALDKIIKNILANMKDEDAENIIQQVSASAIADLALKHNPVDSDEEEHHKHINDVADSSASRAASTLASLQKLQLQEDDPSRQLNESEEKQIEESSKALVNNLVSKSVEALEQASTDKDESPEKAAEAAHSLLSKQIKNFLEQEKPTPSSAKTTTQPSTESTQPEPAVNIEDLTDFVLSRSVDVSNEETPLSAEEAALAEKLALQKKMVIPDDVIDAVQELASQNLEQFIQQSQAKENSQPESEQSSEEVPSDKQSSQEVDEKVSQVASDIANRIFNGLTAEMEALQTQEMLSKIAKDAIDAMIKNILDNMKDEDAERIIKDVSVSSMAQLALKHNPEDEDEIQHHPHINEVADSSASRAADTLASLQKLQLKEDNPDKELNSEEIKQIEESSKSLVDNLVQKSVEQLENASAEQKEDPAKAAEAAHGLLSKQIKNFFEVQEPQDLTEFVVSRSAEIGNDETPLSSEEAALAEKLQTQQKSTIPETVIEAVHELASQNLQQFVSKDEESKLETEQTSEEQPESKGGNEKVEEVVSDIANRVLTGIFPELEALHTQEALSKIAKDEIDRIIKNILDEMKDEDAEKIIQQVSVSAMAQLALKHNPEDEDEIQHHPHINEVADSSASRAADTLASLQKLQLQEDDPNKELNSEEIKQIEESSKSLVDNLVQKSVEELEKASTDKDDDPSKASEAAHGLLSKQIKNFLESEKNKQPSTKSQANSDAQLPIDIDELTDFVVSRSANIDSEETPLSSEEAALAEAIHKQQIQAIPDEVIEAVHDLAKDNLEKFAKNDEEQPQQTEEEQPDTNQIDEKVAAVANDIANRLFNNQLSAEMEALQTQEALSKVAKDAIDEIIRKILDSFRDDDSEKVIKELSLAAMAGLAKDDPLFAKLAEESSEKAAEILAELQKQKILESDPNREFTSEEEEKIKENAKDLVKELLSQLQEDIKSGKDPDKISQAASELLAKKIEDYYNSKEEEDPEICSREIDLDDLNEFINDQLEVPQELVGQIKEINEGNEKPSDEKVEKLADGIASHVYDSQIGPQVEDIEEREKLEKERLENERKLEEERLENERKLEEERLENERKLEEERLEKERQLEQERLERERKLEEERLEREKQLEEERLEREKKLEEERLEKERLEEEKKLQEEKEKRERELKEKEEKETLDLLSGMAKKVIDDMVEDILDKMQEEENEAIFGALSQTLEGCLPNLMSNCKSILSNSFQSLVNKTIDASKDIINELSDGVEKEEDKNAVAAAVRELMLFAVRDANSIITNEVEGDTEQMVTEDFNGAPLKCVLDDPQKLLENYDSKDNNYYVNALNDVITHETRLSIRDIAENVFTAVSGESKPLEEGSDVFEANMDLSMFEEGLNKNHEFALAVAKNAVLSALPAILDTKKDFERLRELPREEIFNASRHPKRASRLISFGLNRVSLERDKQTEDTTIKQLKDDFKKVSLESCIERMASPEEVATAATEVSSAGALVILGKVDKNDERFTSDACKSMSPVLIKAVLSNSGLADIDTVLQEAKDAINNCAHEKMAEIIADSLAQSSLVTIQAEENLAACREREIKNLREADMEIRRNLPDVTVEPRINSHDDPVNVLAKFAVASAVNGALNELIAMDYQKQIRSQREKLDKIRMAEEEEICKSRDDKIESIENYRDEQIKMIDDLLKQEEDRIMKEAERRKNEDVKAAMAKKQMEQKKREEEEKRKREEEKRKREEEEKKKREDERKKEEERIKEEQRIKAEEEEKMRKQREEEEKLIKEKELELQKQNEEEDSDIFVAESTKSRDIDFNAEEEEKVVEGKVEEDLANVNNTSANETKNEETENKEEQPEEKHRRRRRRRERPHPVNPEEEEEDSFEYDFPSDADVLIDENDRKYMRQEQIKKNLKMKAGSVAAVVGASAAVAGSIFYFMKKFIK